MCIPQSLTGIWFSFVSLKLLPDRYVKRMIIYSIIQSVYVAVLFFIVPSWVHILNSLLSPFLFLTLVFPEIRMKNKFFVILFMTAISACFDLIYAYFAILLGGYEQILYNSILFKIVLFWPGFLAIAFLTAFMLRKKIHFARELRAFTIHVRSGPYLMLLSLVLVQVVLFMIFFSHVFIKPLHAQTLQIMIITSIMLFICITIKIMQIIACSRIEGMYQSQDTYIRDLTHMFASIRGQRHDFANHVQVMYSMLALKKYEQLQTYMEEVVNEIQSTNVAIVDLPSPALAALVQAKAAIAAEKNIQFDYLIHTTSLTFNSVTCIDLVRIIGNLVDNAFDEVVKLPEAERGVHLEMFVHNNELYITVINRGNQLSTHMIAQIFQPGYTTKSNGHLGLGLANVLERVRSYNGKVSVESDMERGVVFTIKIPETSSAQAKFA